MLVTVDGSQRESWPTEAQTGRRFYVRLARSWSEVEAAQRLRWRVFSEELGARLESKVPGLDCDAFDDHCDHLLAFEASGGRVVGTYRILTPNGATRAGGCYAEREFILTPLSKLRTRTAEIGRSCVDPAWRGSAVLALLWSGVVNYARERKLSYLIGCASVSMADGGAYAADLFKSLRPHMIGPDLQVKPLRGLDVDRLATGAIAEPPTLIRGYLRAGAQVCGIPAVDPDFNTADFLMMLDIEAISKRFARRFELAVSGAVRQPMAA